MHANDWNPKRHRSRMGLLPGILIFCLLLAGCALLLGEPSTETMVFEVETVPVPETTEPTPATPGDTTAPLITEISELLTYAGDPLSYDDALTVTDDTDPAPVVTVDDSAVDLTAPGTYSVWFTATDTAGNSSRAGGIVTVLAKQPGFVDLAAINDAADEIIGTIIWTGSTVTEQVSAIYRWAREHLIYAGHSDRADWRQTAYTVLNELRCDCYGYYAVTKLLFQRLEIPNIDVRKVRNSPADTDHFWSLVSVDGGSSYYHFDATPRVGEGDDFCLVTDAFLDDYSAAHSGSHNRDASLYPATPEEPLP